jgi:IS4 transposase
VSRVTRLKSNAHTEVIQVLQRSATLHDDVIRLGSGSGACTHPMRVIAVLYRGKWYRYLTNETDPARLPAASVVALYWQRWRIEEALNVVKWLLGLAYFWAGSLNAIQMQLWATWIVYAVLIDLTDAVAEELRQPFAALSVEMVYRGLYHFTQARQRGETDDMVTYLAVQAKGLGIVKRKRRSPKDAFLADLTQHGSP